MSKSKSKTTGTRPMCAGSIWRLQGFDLDAFHDRKGVGPKKVEQARQLVSWAKEVNESTSMEGILAWIQKDPLGRWDALTKQQGRTYRAVGAESGLGHETVRNREQRALRLFANLLPGSFTKGQYQTLIDLASREDPSFGVILQRILDASEGNKTEEAEKTTFRIKGAGSLTSFKVQATNAEDAAKQAALNQRVMISTVSWFDVTESDEDGNEGATQYVMVTTHPKAPDCYTGEHVWELVKYGEYDNTWRCSTCQLLRSERVRTFTHPHAEAKQETIVLCYGRNDEPNSTVARLHHLG